MIYYFEDIEIGQTATLGRTITETDIVMFAGVTGDTNPVHLNEEYGKATVFKGRIAHGMITAGLISAVFGTVLPGPGCIYVSQSLKFKAPVHIQDTVVVTVEVKEKDAAKKRITLACVAKVYDKVVVEGEGVLMVPSRAG